MAVATVLKPSKAVFFTWSRRDIGTQIRVCSTKVASRSNFKIVDYICNAEAVAKRKRRWRRRRSRRWRRRRRRCRISSSSRRRRSASNSHPTWINRSRLQWQGRIESSTERSDF
jgi:hypothetical protein